MAAENLEVILEKQYKSEGERRIAGHLEQYGIPFLYEKPTLVIDSGKPRIWYPDLTIYGSIILEYFGFKGNNDGYDNGIEHKKKIYRENQLDLISVYPSHLQNAWREYILSSMDAILNGRGKEFQETVARNSLQSANSFFSATKSFTPLVKYNPPDSNSLSMFTPRNQRKGG